MEFSIDPFAHFFGNLKKMRSLDSEMFSIILNENEISLPLFTASLISTKIMRLLIEDSTLRTLKINIDFKNKSVEDKIKSLLLSEKQSSTIEFENDEEIIDMANFGVLFGNESFIEPLVMLFEKQKKESIDVKNAISRIESKDMLSHIKNNVDSTDQEMNYISQNFSKFYNNKKFIEWSKKKENEDRVERIINNKDLKLEKEDDLFTYIVEISKGTSTFVRLLSRVHLPLCTADTFKKLIELTKKEDYFISRNNREAIIDCFSSLQSYYDVITFLTQEFDRNYASKDGYCRDSLNIAAYKGNLEVIQYLCKVCKISNVETKDSNGRTPINNAARNGHLEVVKYLYKTCRADVETIDKYGHTPLNNASEKGHVNIVRYLYETCHANAETKDKYGRTPIDNALLYGNLEVVKYLYEKCHANVPDDAINDAIKKNRLDLVKCLYETCHANLETRDDNERTPMINASLNGYIDVVKYISETCHANVEIKDNIGRSPINWASLNGHFGVVKYLHETCYAKVEERDNDGNTPINNASKRGHLDIVRYLYEKCYASVETENNNGYTPLKNASSNGHYDVVKYLRETCHARI